MDKELNTELCLQARKTGTMDLSIVAWNADVKDTIRFNNDSGSEAWRIISKSGTIVTVVKV